MTRIVAGYHASQAALRALAVAKDLGARMDADIHVVHGIDLGDYPVDPDAGDWEEEAEAHILAEEDTVETVMGDYPGRWYYHAVRDDPYHAICGKADQVDAAMIVVGSHGGGAGRVAERLAGTSTVKRLLNSAGRPVLVVTTRGHPS
jgi:nucleotide-binding universal stress UspA family protein